MEILKDAITLFVQFVNEDLPLFFLYSLIALPFLLLISEIFIRKVVNQPFTAKKEVLPTLGYSTIGVVIFLTFFKLFIGIYICMTTCKYRYPYI
ncbi:hypothetical protein [Bacillus sp. REN16]|uniref:hypothetical protein n=1 Tax=Bacillus sp. REN16 TaxID=2887296 RepID=UPI001E5656F2|nr:hypothetical protein [Bacillus sp. REN16]MCC3359477.1 hypothetical protein [Bacillus sp. REN16]